jgi:hypothetical protein
MLNFRAGLKAFLGVKSTSDEGKEALRPKKNKETSFFSFKKIAARKNKKATKSITPVPLSDLEFSLLTKKPLRRSPLDNAIYAAKQIHYTTTENNLNAEGRRIQKQTKFDGQEINVYVNAHSSFSPNNLTSMLDLCTELNNR